MKNYAMVVDYQYCTGCHACELACRNEKGLPLDEWGIKVTQYGPAVIQGEVMWDYVPVPSSACDLCIERIEAGNVPSCQLHCLAACIKVLPVEETAQALREYGDKTAVFVP
ncbi:MAG: oxidoreductase [Eggerthellaceae bacterium]|nr:oxidoreductase [Eggerthellaceae bacterium]